MLDQWQDTLEIPDPLVGRYLASEGLLEPASRKLSEAALYLDYSLKVELALLVVLQRRGQFDRLLLDGAREAAARVTLREFKDEENRVRHDLKALVNVFARHCPEGVRPFIHLGATSYDILSNAHLLRLRAGVQDMVRPLLVEVAAQLARLAEQHAGTPQIGRTHGQYAEPLTFGYAMAVYLERFGQGLEALDDSLLRLRGKFSGAVGAYTTPALLHADPRQLEVEVLAEVGLEPSWTSTQIAHPEPALAVLHHLTSLFGVLANLADDLRHLQRSEIGEVAEAYQASSQVGSSAMPHKRNPITWENVKSLWKTFMPQLMTFYMDQISEHQRDLSNSASARFLPRLLLGLAVAARRTAKGLEKLAVDEKAMRERLIALEEVFSGPLQALLSQQGMQNAHEVVRVLTVRARDEKRSFLELAREHLPANLQAADPAALAEPARLATLRALDYWRPRLIPVDQHQRA